MFGIFEDDFPNFPRWDMLIPWRVRFFFRGSKWLGGNIHQQPWPGLFSSGLERSATERIRITGGGLVVVFVWYVVFTVVKSLTGTLPPRKLTWNLKMMVFNRNLLFQGSFSGSMLAFGGVTRFNQGPSYLEDHPRRREFVVNNHGALLLLSP